LLSKSNHKSVTIAASITIRNPYIGVCANDWWRIIKPPIYEPKNMPMLKAEIFNAEAIEIADGIYFSDSRTAYSCNPGTFINMNNPIVSTIINPIIGDSRVKPMPSNANASPTKIIKMERSGL